MFVNQDPTSSVRIIDFGFATKYNPARGPLHKQLGTFDTMSPEVFGGNYDTKADLWSAGVVAYELSCGKKPFAAMTPLAVIGKIAQGSYNLTDHGWKQKSKENKDFIRALLIKDTKKRLSAGEALHHSWIQNMVGDDDSQTMDTSFKPSLLEDQIESFGKAPVLKRIGLLLIAHKSFPAEVVELRKQFER